MEEKYQQLKERLARVRDLKNAESVLNWDQETYMPPGGAQGRADSLATLAALAHQYFVDEEIGQLLEDLKPYEEQLDPASDEASLIRVTRREYLREVRVPASLVEERARTSSLAHHAWVEAREKDDFSIFAPLLEKQFELAIQYAECFEHGGNPYNPLLDAFEPGIDSEQIVTVSSGLKPELVELAAEISAHQDRVDDSPMRVHWDEKAQIEFSRQVTEAIGYDYQRGRMDLAAHPFSISFSQGDVRITTRVDSDFIGTCLMGSIHEAGHAMYEQNISPALYRTGLDTGASMAVHESQSRFYENIVGRSLPFWRYWYPKLQAALPTLKPLSLEKFYKALNKSQPSLIRTEADEVTYGLHIILRFELEKDLIEGRVKVADLPQEWNDRMERYLGVRPPNDALGVLQDIHWSWALIGYFPDYLLGSIFAVQLWERMKQDIPDVEAQIERGEFGAVLGWQCEHVHQHGSKFTLPELAQRITGGPLRWEPYMAYLRAKYGEVYGLPVARNQ